MKQSYVGIIRKKTLCVKITKRGKLKCNIIPNETLCIFAILFVLFRATPSSGLAPKSTGPQSKNLSTTPKNVGHTPRSTGPKARKRAFADRTQTDDQSSSESGICFQFVLVLLGNKKRLFGLFEILFDLKSHVSLNRFNFIRNS